MCPTLCNPIDGSPLGSSVPGILQARILEWVAISFPNARKWKVKVKLLSRAQLLTTPWMAAYQVSPSMEFSRPEYGSGLPLPSPMLCYAKSLQLCMTFCYPWIGAHQAPLSMKFSRQEYRSGLPFPFPEDLPTEPPGKPYWYEMQLNSFSYLIWWNMLMYFKMLNQSWIPRINLCMIYT